jgi:hypothetical protein
MLRGQAGMAAKVAVLVSLCVAQAHADDTGRNTVSAELGISIDDEVLPFVDVEATLVQLEPGYKAEFSASAKVPLYQSHGEMGDTSFNGDIAIAANISKRFTLRAGTNFDFERDVTDVDTDTSHGPGASAGVDLVAGHLRFVGDVATTLNLFEEAGLRDHFDNEVAIRILKERGRVRPFVEAAFVWRDYLDNDGRNFSGPEFIAGVELAMASVTGQVGAIVAHRSEADGDDRWLLGPYLEVTWKPAEGTELLFALASGFEQESIGSNDVYEVLSGTIELQQDISDTIATTATLEVAIENDPGPGKTVIIEPSILVEYDIAERKTLMLRAAGSFEGEPGATLDDSYSLRAGVRLAF